MSYPIPTQEQIRDTILGDWRNQDNLVTVSLDSDNYIRASGIASAIVGLYQFATWGINQYFPDTSDAENLARFAQARGITQKPAVGAAGTVSFSGTVGAAIPLATIVQTADGKQYQTTVLGTIGGAGTVSVAAAAVNVGPVGNQPDDTPGVLQTAPVGVDAAVLLAQMSGGVDAESLVSLLTRVLDRLRQPPAGGNKFDYPRWALEVAGVTSAFGYPTRRGIGSIDVAILSNGLPPSDLLRAAVGAYINDRKPVEADCMVLAPQLVPVDIAATVVLDADTQLSVVTAKALTALATYFATLKPGDTARRSRVQTILGDIDGVIDFDLAAPAANVITQVDAAQVQMPSLGVVAIGL
ncbi:MAG: baseplate J/gp47 family protein [Oxalobacteraceae bacterium]|nr:baseplate J/gp47 family protein [Oxalobacteraceae bacterium]